MAHRDSDAHQESNVVRESDLLRVLLAMAGRIAFPETVLATVVGPTYTTAYNMCTGNASVAAIARAAGIDGSNLRKAMQRWEQAGVLYRVGPQEWPLRLYQLQVNGENGRRSKQQPTRETEPDDLQVEE